MFFFFLLRDKGKTDLSVKPQSITIFRKKNIWLLTKKMNLPD
jgi:hypothetical protein